MYIHSTLNPTYQLHRIVGKHQQPTTTVTLYIHTYIHIITIHNIMPQHHYMLCSTHVHVADKQLLATLLVH